MRWVLGCDSVWIWPYSCWRVTCALGWDGKACDKSKVGSWQAGMRTCWNWKNVCGHHDSVHIITKKECANDALRFLELWYSPKAVIFFPNLFMRSQWDSMFLRRTPLTPTSMHPHPSVLMASILRTSTWFYFLVSRLANSCMCFQTEDVTTADHFTGITGTSVRKME